MTCKRPLTALSDSVGPAHAHARPAIGYAVAMWCLLVLFCLRVVGQGLVAFFGVPFLPPMEAWQSGLLPYRWLLLSQVVIIGLYGKVCVDFTRGRGLFVVPRRVFGLGVLGFGSAYLAVMVTRYVVRMGIFPLERWTGGSIPTFFHWVLAVFLLTLGFYHWVRTRRSKQQIRWSPLVAGAWPILVLIGLAIILWSGYQLAALPPPGSGSTPRI